MRTTKFRLACKPVFCWFLLLPVFACQSGNKRSENAPDAVRDLLIDRIFWQVSPGESQTNLHRFTISNTSPRYSYSQIAVRLDYYDRDHHKIDSSKQTVRRTVEPRAAITIDELRAGPAKPETASATVTVIGAAGN